MPQKKYLVTLTPEEREQLAGLLFLLDADPVTPIRPGSLPPWL